MNKQVTKIVVLGPESTGKSTLSEGLAAHFDTDWVPEFARRYCEQLDRPYEYADLLQIAKGQIALEDAAIAEMSGSLLFCDTDLQVIRVWSEHKYGRCDDWILQTIAERHYDYYFLTDVAMPWEPDPLREYPEPEMRQYFFNVYRQLVIDSGRPWQFISGDATDRLSRAVAIVNKWRPR